MITILPTLDTAIVMNAVITGMDEAIVKQSVKLGLLDSALAAPMAGFGDVDLYPADHQRLGVLCCRIVLNHPFLDGNKRTGFLLMRETAYLNSIELDFPDQHEAADWVEAVASGTMNEDEFCAKIETLLL